MPDPSNEPDLSWLANSPMFIDSQQIGAFYDAVVGPAFRTVELQISAERTGQLETSVTVRLGAKLTALFPWLRVDADAEGRRTTTKGRQEGENVVLQPVESATRQLVELSLHYLVNQHDRVRGGRPRWVNYRARLHTGETLHLHVVARGDYDTGVFATISSGGENATA